MRGYIFYICNRSIFSTFLKWKNKHLYTSTFFLNCVAGFVLIFFPADVFPVADSFIFLEYVLAHSIAKPLLFLLVIV